MILSRTCNTCSNNRSISDTEVSLVVKYSLSRHKTRVLNRLESQLVDLKDEWQHPRGLNSCLLFELEISANRNKNHYEGKQSMKTANTNLPSVIAFSTFCIVSNPFSLRIDS